MKEVYIQFIRNGEFGNISDSVFCNNKKCKHIGKMTEKGFDLFPCSIEPTLKISKGVCVCEDASNTKGG